MNARLLVIILVSLGLSYCSSYSAKSQEEVSSSTTQLDRNSSGKIQAGLPGSSKQETKRILTYHSNIYFDIPDRSVDQVRTKIIEYVKSSEGYIVTENTNNLTVKVPSSNFREALQEIKKFGKVTNEYVHTEDITEAYYDVKIRLDNYLALQTRLTALLTRAKTVQEAIEVEKELNRVTNEIEVLKGKLNRYENQINFSTITIYIRPEKTTKLGPLGWIFYGAYSALRWLFIWD